MNKAITYSELLTEIKGLLVSQDYDETQVKFALNGDRLPGFQEKACIYIVPNEIEFDHIVNQGAWNEEVRLSIFCVRKDGHVDIDADFIAFLEWVQAIIKVLRPATFYHRIVKQEVDGIAGFDTLIATKESFLHTAEIQYRAIIKGVTDV